MRLCPRLLPARAHEPRREAEPSKPPSAVACAPARMWLFHSLLCVTSKSASPLAPQGAAVPSARPVCLCVWWGSEPEVREEVGPPPGGMLLLGGSDPPWGWEGPLRLPLTLDSFGLRGSASCSSCHLPSPCVPFPQPGVHVRQPLRSMPRFSSECASPPAQQSPLLLHRKGLAEEGVRTL